MRRFAGFWTLAAIGLLICTGEAYGHKLKVFATGDGRQISGYVYFPGGGRAQGLTVAALAPDGSECGTAVTDADGRFVIPVELQGGYTLVAQTADGHRAEFRVEAEELSDSLPQRGPVTQVEGGDVPARSAEHEADEGDIRTIVQQAVHEQVRPLREQLEAYEEKVRVHDVIGGVGYIVGAAGIAFYFLGVRKCARADTGER